MILYIYTNKDLADHHIPTEHTMFVICENAMDALWDAYTHDQT